MDVRVFDMKRAQRTTKLSTIELAKLIEFFVQRGTIQRHNRPEGLLYTFVKPQADEPVRRRKQPPPEVTARRGGQATDPPRGMAIPRTGRPLGPSGKPGERKRNIASGKSRKGRRGVK